MHLGLVGYGSIGATVLERLGETAGLDITVLARPGRCDSVAEALRRPDRSDAHPYIQVVPDAQGLIAARPDLLVECAGHEAVRSVVLPALRAGIDAVVVSVGALCDSALEAQLRQAALAGGARMILPAGAIGGIDLLSALSAAGSVEVTYRGIKPPAAWKGTPAEQTVDLDRIDRAVTFFTGTARQAAAAFPKNANVAATLALAGPGFDATQVALVADPAASGNRHIYAVRSPIASYEISIDNAPSAGNARTSAATIYSVLREIRNRIGPMVI